MSNGLAARYTAEIQEQLKYLATWPPDDTVRVGDVGVLDGHRFVPVSTLGDIGIAIAGTRTIGQGDTSYTSKESTRIDLKTRGAAGAGLTGLADADAGIVVGFDRAEAIALAMRSREATRIEDQVSLGNHIVDAWRDKVWRSEWCAVVEVVRTEATTVIISSGKDARLELRASAAAADPSGVLSLADLSLGLERVHEHHVGLQVISKPGATPLFRALRLKKHLWARTPEVVIEGLERVDDDDHFLDPATVESLFDLLGAD